MPGSPRSAKCGLRGSPTIVKKVFAPPPRAEKAHADRDGGPSMEEIAEALIDGNFQAPARA